MGRWGGSSATAEGARGGVLGGAPQRGLARHRRRCRPACPHCAYALLPASWGAGAPPWGEGVAATPQRKARVGGCGRCRFQRGLARSASPPPRLLPLRLHVAACKLGGGERWGGRNATVEGVRARAWAVPPNAGWHAVRPPPRLAPLRLRVAACKLWGGERSLGALGRQQRHSGRLARRASGAIGCVHAQLLVQPERGERSGAPCFAGGGTLRAAGPWRAPARPTHCSSQHAANADSRGTLLHRGSAPKPTVVVSQRAARPRSAPPHRPADPHVAAA